MLPPLAVASLAVIVQLLIQPPYPDHGKTFTITPPKVRGNVTFVPIGKHLGEPRHAVDCAMPMLKPEGDVDPKIIVEPPKDVDFKIRIIEAPRCK